MRDLILNNLHVIFLMLVWTVLVSFGNNFFYAVVLYVGFLIGIITRYDRMKKTKEVDG